MNQLPLDLQSADPSYRLIRLTQGQIAKVDAEDFDRINQWKWCAHWDRKARSFRAERGRRDNGKTVYVSMAREVMGHPEGLEVDHRFHDTLDNRKSQLRIATHAQNCHNQRRRRDNSSGHKGVCWVPSIGKWRVRITLHGKRKLIGEYLDKGDATAAAKNAAEEMHGEFARR